MYQPLVIFSHKAEEKYFRFINTQINEDLLSLGANNLCAARGFGLTFCLFMHHFV